MSSIASKLREALTGTEGPDHIVWLGNFEVEQYWANAGALHLPDVPDVRRRRLNNSLAELALLPARPGDAVVLEREPDPDFVAYLERTLDLRAPQVILAPPQAGASLTESGLQSADTVAALQALSRDSAFGLFPHGASAAEERLAAQSGLALLSPPAALCRRVNSKVYSRRLSERLGIRQPLGAAVCTLDELLRAFEELKPLLKQTPLVLKEGFGVSGKGMLLLSNAARFEQVFRVLLRSAERTGVQEIELVLEAWLPRASDLNCQLVVGRDGRCDWLTAFEAVVDGGVHQGHRCPPVLPGALLDEARQAAMTLGGALAEEGYHGPVGIDAMIGADSKLYPCLEINARLNMSTYYTPLIYDRLPAGKTVRTRHFTLRKSALWSFRALHAALGEVLYPGRCQTGAILMAFAPVNPDPSDPGLPGRLYLMFVGDTREDTQAQENEVLCRIRKLEASAGVQEGGDDFD